MTEQVIQPGDPEPTVPIANPAIPDGNEPQPEAIPEGDTAVHKELAGTSTEDGQTQEVSDTETTADTPETKVNFEDLVNEWNQNEGKLTDDSLKSLEVLGISSEQVEIFAAGMQARQDALIDRVSEPIGGAEAFKDLIDWAGKNLTPEEIDAANSVLGSTDAPVEQRQLVLQGLQAKRNAGKPTTPNRTVNGDPAPTMRGFASNAEFEEALNHPDYQKSEAFRDKVAEKLARSSF